MKYPFTASAFFTQSAEKLSAILAASLTGAILKVLLILKQGIWYVYAFCHTKRAFRLFHLGRILFASKTEETFTRRPFAREDIPLSYWLTEKTVNARFEISEGAFPDALDWLGVENLKLKDGRWYADVTLPDDIILLRKIVSLGPDFKVLEPEDLRQRVAQTAKEVAALYN